MAKDRRLKILHIDDDEDFLETFRKTYGDEFDIVSVNGGRDVPEIVSREMPDALVLDYELPGRNGLELLAAIKEKYPSLPVIFYTGQGNEEIARQAFSEGATDYFVKRTADFAQKEKLVNSIQKALEKKAVEQELAEKQAMLESFIEHNPYAVQLFNPEGKHDRVNKAFIKLFGAAPSSKEVIVFDETLKVPDEVKEAMRKDWLEKRKNYSVFTDESGMKVEAIQNLMPLWEAGGVVAFPYFWYTMPFPIEGTPIKPKCFGTTGFSVKGKCGKIRQYVFMFEDITSRVLV